MSAESLRGTRLGIVGTGVMAEAMLAGLLERDLIAPADVICTHPRSERRDALMAAHGVRTTSDNREATRDTDILLLAVKPQMLGGVMAELRGSLRPEQLVISVIAGASTTALGQGLDHAAVVRSMPNTPAQIGRGVTVWFATEQVDDRGKGAHARCWRRSGASSRSTTSARWPWPRRSAAPGPTYIFLFIEALTDAAVHLGFPRHVARELVLDTMQGSAEFALQSGKHVAELRDMVTSPGGTSAEALYQLERGGLRTVVSDAVWAAFERTLRLEATLENRAAESPSSPHARGGRGSRS